MLIRKVEKFLRRTGMSATRLGREAMSDPCFVRDLRNGREPKLATERTVEHFMNKFEETSHAG